ncbi:sulfotransferase family protein [Novosphingobium taihuense]|uniref:Sulfotransferase family protein n=1 Tax=Novosphingobium taihuense TaxID=260085 RepID=A0A7W7EWI1_9SPHN|nr:sulfotransferase [Novosphingobium taihuense]MBB4614315.1 hypothetical protein [Novosphingobium taihuense]TWH87161.1 sulfotransferase family protein [Novosphingobium taihuense]
MVNVTDKPYAAIFGDWRGTLESGNLLSQAEEFTGLSDWGGRRWDEERFRYDFALLCEGIESTGDLSALGRRRSYARLMTMLVSRLRYLDARKHANGVEAARISAPLIGTGMPRAGTTFLHGLLAQDPALRVAKAFEAAMPVPLDGPEGDARSVIYQELLDFQGMTSDHLTAMHPFGAELPEECLFLQEGACTAIFGGLWNVPKFQAAVADKSAIAFRWQIGLMQYLQTQSGGERWALKTPGHIMTWDELRIAFPDALIYVNHRDPGKVIPSMASLMAALRGLFSDQLLDPLELGKEQLAIWAPTMNAYAAWRNGPGRDAKVVDVVFSDLIARPIETVSEMYDTFGLRLGGDARDRMLRHLERDRHGKAPQRAYSLADYGLDEAAIEGAFGAYIDQFGIRREQR